MKTPKKILIVGATSAIAEAIARQFSYRGDHLCLAARNKQKLDAIANDLRARTPGCFVNCQHFDASESSDESLLHEKLIRSARESMGSLDVVLIAHGVLPDPDVCADSVSEALNSIQINGLSVISLMSIAAKHFQTQGHGTIAVISSVAGDRGRGSNYVYGSAKALVTAFASGLGQKFSQTRIRVVNIKPGFVDTPMTAGIKKGFLWASPEAVAQKAVVAIDSGKPVAYAPGFWSCIMLVVCAIPERLFRKLPL